MPIITRTTTTERIVALGGNPSIKQIILICPGERASDAKHGLTEQGLKQMARLGRQLQSTIVEPPLWFVTSADESAIHAGATLATYAWPQAYRREHPGLDERAHAEANPIDLPVPLMLYKAQPDDEAIADIESRVLAGVQNVLQLSPVQASCAFVASADVLHIIRGELEGWAAKRYDSPVEYRRAKPGRAVLYTVT